MNVLHFVTPSVISSTGISSSVVRKPLTPRNDVPQLALNTPVYTTIQRRNWNKTKPVTDLIVLCISIVSLVFTALSVNRFTNNCTIFSFRSLLFAVVSNGNYLWFSIRFVIFLRMFVHLVVGDGTASYERVVEGFSMYDQRPHDPTWIFSRHIRCSYRSTEWVVTLCAKFST